MNERRTSAPEEMNDLLATKLDFPVINTRAKIIHRNRITEQIEEAIDRPVITCVSPAGYGKTTALGEWILNSKSPERRFAWVTLDAFDNAPLRFWSYCVGALRKAAPAFQYNLQHKYSLDDGFSEPTRLDPLLIEIAQIPGQLYLVLDDFHVITNPIIQQAMDYLIEHQPKNLHLVFASRDALPLRFSKLRIRGQLLEISAEDLAFTPVETAAFLTRVMDLELHPEQMQTLMEITVGWITGIQLAALTLQVQPDILAQPGFRQMKAAFPGGYRQILEYFTDEVLNKLNPDVMSFLVNTSILNPLNAALCDAVAQRDDSQEVIAALEHANLFIIPLDNQGRWYRYHPLFAGALKSYLERVHPLRLPELHHKACDWLLQHGYPLQAVEHALAANEMETAARILDKYAVRALATFNLDLLVKWIDRFSDQWICEHPKLGIYDALANIQLGQLSQIERRLEQLTHALDTAHDKPGWEAEQHEIRWEIQAIRAIADCMRGNYPGVLAQAPRLIHTAPNEHNWVFGALQQWLAEALYETGNLQDAITTFEQASQTAFEQDLLASHVYALCEVARIRKEQGRLSDARQRYAALLAYAEQAGLDNSVKVLIQAALLEIAVECSDLDSAAQWLEKTRTGMGNGAESSPIYFYPVIVSSCMARYELAIGDDAAAGRNLKKAVRVFQGCQQVSTGFLANVVNMLVRVELQPRDPARPGKNLAEEGGWSIAEEALCMGEQLATARVLFARQRVPEALNLLDQLETQYRLSGKDERLIETLALKAATAWSSSQPERAFGALGEALRLAASDHYVRPFLDEGPAMQALLDAFLTSRAQDEGAEYAAILRAEFARYAARRSRASAEASAEASAPAQREDSDGPLLSPREISIVKLIAAGASSKDVAGAMVISLNTVKVHLKRIYKKLNIHTRSELIEYIREHHLLST